jgi:hypothetical protein
MKGGSKDPSELSEDPWSSDPGDEISSPVYSNNQTQRMRIEI